MRAFIIFLMSLTMVQSAFAKFPTPELKEIYPAGGQVGTEFIVSLAGDGLEDLKELRFSNPQIKAERVYHPQSAAWPEKRAKGKTFKVFIPKNIQPGNYDVRVLGYYGLSSPRIFNVSNAVEVNSESQPKHNNPETALPLEIEQVANGKIRKQYADYYKINLKKNQRVLIHCWAERLGSKLDAKLTVHNSKGQEIYNVNDHIGRDPLIDFTAPASAEYFISVSDHTWDGTTGYVYRMKVSEKPYIESIYPAVVQKGKQTQHIIFGRLLPGGKKTSESSNGGPLESVAVNIQASMTEDEMPLDGSRPLLGFYKGINYSYKGSNSFRLAFVENESFLEREQDADIAIKIPSEIIGQFNKEQDIDRYRFSAKKGDKLWIEVFADRQYSKSDPFVVIEKITKDKKGLETSKDFASLDDFRKVKTQGMYDIHTYDNGKEIHIDADGDYRIIVGDNFSKHGALHHYRLHVSHSKPDFQLLTFVEQFHFYGDRRTTVYPGALQLRPNDILPIRVRACRKGGKEHSIELKVEGLPDGVQALSANIFPGEEEAYIVLKSDKEIKNWAGNIRVYGKIKDGSKTIEREAAGATLNWSGTEITYGYTQRLRARRTANIPLSLLADEQPVPITLGQKDPAKIWDFKKKGSQKIPIVSKRTDELKGAVTVMEFGASHKLKFPFRINLSHNKESSLNISYHPDSKNLHLPGEGSFIMRGWADIKYTTFQKGFESAKKNKEKADSRLKELNAVFKKSESEVKKLKAELAKALQQEKKQAEDQKKAAAKSKQPSKPAALILKSPKIKESLKQAEDTFKKSQANLNEIKNIQKEMNTEFNRVKKFSQDVKFRAGFFSVPVRFRIVDEVKKEKKK